MQIAWRVRRCVPYVQLLLEGDAVTQEILRQQAPSRGRIMRKDTISAGKYSREEDDRVEEVVEIGFRVGFPWSRDPLWSREKDRFPVQESRGYLCEAQSMVRESPRREICDWYNQEQS